MSTDPVPRPADAHNIDQANALSMFTIAVAGVIRVANHPAG
ncbi:MAG: hypothetical protein ACYDGN_18005 [Acidimicrobiales bacterium]